MELILQTISGLGLWSAGFALLLAYWLYVLGGLHEPGNAVARERWVRRLREGDWSRSYRAGLGRALDRVDLWLTPELARGERLGPARAAWSAGALNLTFLLALAYPVLAPILQWAWTGAAAEIGGLELLPAEFDRLGRLGTLAFIACLFLVVWRAYALGRLKNLDGRFNWITIAFLIMGSMIVSIEFSDIESFLLIEVISVACVIVCAVIFLGWYSVLDEFPGTFFTAVAITIVGSVTLGFVLAYEVAGAIISLATILGVLAVAVIVAAMGSWFGRHALIKSLHAILTIAAIATAVRISPTSLEAKSRTAVLFFGLQPLLNGLTDFGSLGLTRWLLREKTLNRGWSFGWSSLADTLGAAVFLFLLVALSLAAVVFGVKPGAEPLIDLDALFAGLRSRPQDYWWLGFMVFSTLLPTLLHFIVALSSITLLTPRRLRLRIADGLEAGAAGDWERGRAAKLALAGLASFALWWPAFVVLYGGYWIWSADHGLRDGLVYLAELYVGWLRGFA